MAFEGLSEKLNATFKHLRGKGRLSEEDIKLAMREVRLALLEADVSYKVVKDFVKTVSERAVGAEVLDSLTPAQQVIKIVSEELTALMGGANAKLTFASKPPTIVMMVGLQGAGKTTNVAKLAGYFRKQGHRPLLTACDVYRPAAITQLQVVGKQLNIPVFEMGQIDPVQIAQEAVKYAGDHGNDMVFLDTAGRLHIDEALMDELDEIKSAVNPAEILLVIDAMTGQEAANVAAVFNERLAVTGIILSKLDSDTRGGAALSVRAITGKPVKFASSGEKINDFEIFYPKRMADRILGMGDVLTLIDKAVELYDEKKAEELEKKLATQTFTLDDFLDQLQQIKKMGGIGGLLKLLPGAAQIKEEEIDEKQFVKIEAIIQSMTKREKRNPDLLNASRRKRIAAGSGTTVQDVNRLMKQFEEMRAMMKRFGGKGKRGIGRKMFGGKMPDIFL
ncbi:MAG TPA: signal recognition particle protein [Clostridiales bacterium]|nr:signal recognition particle protein [Clostridiales bacterium]